MNKPIFKWLLIFKDGTHLNAEGEEIEDACKAVGRTRDNLSVSTVGFLKALPLGRVNTEMMSQETKDYLKKLTSDRRSLRNSGRKKSKPQTQARPISQTPKIKRPTALDKILEN